MMVGPPRIRFHYDNTMKHKYILSAIENWISQMSTYNPVYCKKAIERTDYILDTLNTEYTKQTFTGSCSSFIICIHQMRANLRNDDNQME